MKPQNSSAGRKLFSLEDKGAERIENKIKEQRKERERLKGRNEGQDERGNKNKKHKEGRKG